tara:strand:+ start:4418 stop:5086 length:669 start_codon:yes stop_codon:yes gene_type:complete
MKAMILAAGRGERLRPMTDTVPKALVEVQGRSLIDWHLDKIADAGIRDVVINLGWLGHCVQAHVGDGSRFGITVQYSEEGENILETGGGIHRALPLLGSEPFLVINADVFTEMPMPGIRLAPDCLGHLVLVPQPAHRAQGDFILDSGRVRNAESCDLTFSGVALYRPALFKDCSAGRFSIVPLLRAAADNGKLQGSRYDGPWADVGTAARLEAANSIEAHTT